MARNIEEHGEDGAFFSCTGCGGVIEEQHRYEMMLAGRWVAEDPTARVIGFHLWTAYSPLESWSSIAASWLKAKGDPAAEQTFLNDVAGLPYRAAGESPPWEKIRDRAEAEGRKRGTVPKGGLLLVLAIDVQADRIEWTLKAGGRNRQRWTVEVGVIAGAITEPDTRAELDRLLRREWFDFQGGRRPIDLAVIDGNYETDEVFEWVRRHPKSKLLMVRGVSSDQAPAYALVRHERDRKGKVKRYQGRFFNIGTSGLKMAIYRDLRKEDPLERGYNGFPAGLPDEFYVQLTCERRTPHRQRDGFVSYRWTKPAAQANEALDMEVYATAALIKLDWRTLSDAAWDRLEAERETPRQDAQLDLEDLVAVTAVRLDRALAQRAASAPAAPAARSLASRLA